MSMLKSVKVKNLSKEIGGKRILDKINLVVDRDERVVICGPSGSGKTTLLRCLNGLEAFDSGMVTVIGMRLDGSEESVRNVRLKTGMLFQSYNLFPHLTVLENCTLAMIKVKKYTIQRIVYDTNRILYNRTRDYLYQHRHPILFHRFWVFPPNAKC